MHPTTPDGHSCLPCGLYPAQRNRYFDGKLLVTRDFQDEQQYLRGKDRLHNSLLHGAGTVCGLKIEPHPNPACRHQYVVLKPGLALDCCGQEIVVEQDVVIDLRQQIETALRQANRFPDTGPPAPTPVYIRLGYQECPTELVPALLDDCGCDPAATEFNRIQEGYHLWVDLTPPTTEAEDAVNVQLEWQHTLAVAHPEAIAVDRDLQRLYLVEWDGAQGWLRMYDSETHRLLRRVALGDRRPTALTLSNQGDLLYVAEESRDDVARIVLLDQPALEGGTGLVILGAIALPTPSDMVKLGTTVREDNLLALVADGTVRRWSSDALRSVVSTVKTRGAQSLTDPVSAVVAIAPVAVAQIVTPNRTLSYPLRVTNRSSDPQTLTLSATGNTWETTLSSPRLDDLPPGETVTVTVTVVVPATAAQGSADLVTITATPEGTPAEAEQATLMTSVTQPVIQLLSEATGADPVTPVDMAQSPDGRWLMVADGSAARVIALNLSQFDPVVPLVNRMHAFDLLAGDIPTRLELSYDGEVLYLLSAAGQRLYRAQVSDRLDQLLPNFIGSEDQLFTVLPLVDDPTASAPQPLDIGISPRDNWVYVLRQGVDDSGAPLDRGEVMVLSVEAMNGFQGVIAAAEAATVRVPQAGVNTQGRPQFHHLAFLGQRLYVAGGSPDDATSGSISIVYVNESDCGAYIRRSIDPCPTCESAQEGVILASIAGYRWNLPMVTNRSEGADEDTENLIDNLRDRPLVPSTSTLRQVIECMLRKGISEGIPGPRGPVGPDGPRGPGITEVAVTSLPANEPADADLEAIAADAEGDQRLVLRIPQGQPGNPGPRGPGIVAVTATTLAPGSTATANLQAIAGDPEGDQRLLLGIPRGADGTSPEPEVFNRVINANWHDCEAIVYEEFFERFVEQGLIIRFQDKVRARSLNFNSAFVMASRVVGGESFSRLEDFTLLPQKAVGVDQLQLADERSLRPWVIDLDDVIDQVEFPPLLVSAEDSGEEFVPGVRLLANLRGGAIRDLVNEFRQLQVVRLSIVLRGDRILDDRGRPLDGNLLWPGSPEGDVIDIPAGGTFAVPGRPSGNATGGGDWISHIYFMTNRQDTLPGAEDVLAINTLIKFPFRG